MCQFFSWVTVARKPYYFNWEQRKKILSGEIQMDNADSHSEILDNIRESKKFPEEEQDKVSDIINEFKKGFSASDGSSVAVDDKTEAMDEEDLEKESGKVRKPAKK